LWLDLDIFVIGGLTGLVGVFVQDHDDGCGDEIIFCLFFAAD